MESLIQPTAEIAVLGPVHHVVPRGHCQVAFLGMAGSDPPRAEVNAWLVRLGALTASMTGGRVEIEAVDRDRKERQYRVRMDLSMPHGVVTVAHDHPSNGLHEDVFVAIRNAFRAGRRELEAYALSHPPAPAPVELPAASAEAPAVAVAVTVPVPAVEAG
jgi:hypothetical protein